MARSAPESSAVGKGLLSPDLRWLAAVAGVVVFVIGTYIALIQAPRPDPLKPAAPSSPEWWRYPYERNAFARLPVITGGLLDISVFADGRNIWAVGERGLIVHSGDGGLSWVRQRVTMAATDVAAAANETPATGAEVAEALAQADALDTQALAQDNAAAATETKARETEKEAETLVKKDPKDSDRLRSEASQLMDEAADARKTAEALRAQAESFRAQVAGKREAVQQQQQQQQLPAPVEQAPPVGTLAGSREQAFFEELSEVHFVDPLRGWAVGESGAILHTRDGGATWASQESGTDKYLRSVQFLADGLRGWAVGRSGTILHTRDGGANWVSQESGTDEILWSVQFLADGLGGWAVGRSSAILHTGDGGATWVPQESGTGGFLWSVQFLADGLRGWAVGWFGTILHTRDGGATWVLQESGWDESLWSVQFLPDGLRGWAVGTSGTIRHTGDGGATWAPQSRSGSSEPRFLSEGQSGWRVTDDDTVEFTTDGGETWQDEAGAYARYPAPWYFLSLLFVVGLVAPVARDAISRLFSKEEEVEEPPESDRKTDDDPDRVPEAQPLNLTGRFASDRPIEAGDPDPLGYGTIARTISLFLRHEKTEPPLTFAITGEWGSGKSSLMNLLRADLVAHGWRPVWFNAWHHQKDAHLLASLLDVIRRQAVPRWWQLSGLWARTKLVFIRLWHKRTLVIPLAALFAAGSLTYRLYPDITEHRTITDFNTVLGNLKPAIEGALPETTTFFGTLLKKVEVGSTVGEFLPAILALAFLWWLARNRLTSGAFSPAKLLAAIAGRTKSGDLGDQLQFRHRFADEFRDMALALSRPRLLSSPLVVFIDDLDRCRPQNVLDILEAVNFLVTSGICYVVIGLDRNRVEACIGLGFKDVAKELTEEPETVRESLPDNGENAASNSKEEKPSLKTSENQVSNTKKPANSDEKEETEREHEERKQRRAYARDYLEKLINIEVPVPELDDDRASRLLGNDGEAATPQARWMLKAAAIIEGYAIRSLLLLAILAGGVNLMLSQAPDAIDDVDAPTTEESSALSGVNTDSGETGESRGADQTTDVPTTTESGQALFLGGQQAKSPDMAMVGTIISVIVILAIMIGEGRRRTRADSVEDSKTFDNELNIWRPVILARRNTPRAIKRYLNRVRYLAMRLRPESPVDESGGVLVRRIRDWHPELRTGAKPAVDEALLKEPMLVAMSAIEFCDRDWLKKDALFQEIHPGLADKLKNDLPDGVDENVVDALVASLEAHVANPRNSWPPLPEQRDVFSDIAAGVRFSGEDGAGDLAPKMT